MPAKKALGQHFLHTPAVARRIARASELSASDTVLEIGPGKGILTRELLRSAGRVIAIEKDTELVAHLEEKFATEIAEGKLLVLTGDVLSVSLPDIGLNDHDYALVANIPYYITGKILRHFLETGTQPHTAVLLVQKEVAEKAARGEKESIFSLSVKAFGVPEYVEKVSRTCFTPQPAVDSAVLKISAISRDFFANVTPAQFFAVVHAGFAHPRKYARSNLTACAPKSTVAALFNAYNIPENARAEDIPLEMWQQLAAELPECART